MSEEERQELERLVDARTAARTSFHNHGYINIAGRSYNDLIAIGRTGARLEAEMIEAEACYRAFMARLDRRTEEAARARYDEAASQGAAP